MADRSATPTAALQRLAEWPLGRRPAHELAPKDTDGHASGYEWRVYGQPVADVEYRHSDRALLIWDRHRSRCYDTGHRFNARPSDFELVTFVGKHAVNLLAPLLARAVATASGWQD